jgi:hypothetical protein
MTPRHILPVLLLLMPLVLAGCVPESDLERVAGTNSGDTNDLTAIPEDDLPDVEDLELRVMSVDIYRSGGRVSTEIAISGGSGDDIRLAEAARVEWSDGEITNALPLPAANILIEAGRSDSEGVLEPVRVYLSNVTRHVGTDTEAEVTVDEIVTRWGSFPVLDIERAQRPPGWKLEFQAAGQRWVSEARLIDEGRFRYGEAEDVSFDDDFAPVSAVLRFGTEFEDLESALPLPAEIEVRQAVREYTLDL